MARKIEPHEIVGVLQDIISRLEKVEKQVGLFAENNTLTTSVIVATGEQINSLKQEQDLQDHVIDALSSDIARLTETLQALQKPVEG